MRLNICLDVCTCLLLIFSTLPCKVASHVHTYLCIEDSLESSSASGCSSCWSERKRFLARGIFSVWLFKYECSLLLLASLLPASLSTLFYSRSRISIHTLLRTFRYSFLMRTPASFYLAHTSAQTNVVDRNCCIHLNSRRNSTEVHEREWEAKDKPKLTVVIIWIGQLIYDTSWLSHVLVCLQL